MSEMHSLDLPLENIVRKGESKAPSIFFLHGFGSNMQDLYGLTPFSQITGHVSVSKLPYRYIMVDGHGQNWTPTILVPFLNRSKYQSIKSRSMIRSISV